MGSLRPEVADGNDADSDVVFANDYVSLRSSGDGQVAVTVGTGRGAVALVYRNGKVLMIRTPRYATDTLEWELPRAGSLEGESAAETAARSVEGWTGVSVSKAGAVSLGTVTPIPSCSPTK